MVLSQPFLFNPYFHPFQIFYGLPEWRQTLGRLGLLCRRFAPSCSYWKRKSLCQEKIKNTAFSGRSLSSAGDFVGDYFSCQAAFLSGNKIPLKESEAHYLQTICKQLYILKTKSHQLPDNLPAIYFFTSNNVFTLRITDI